MTSSFGQRRAEGKPEPVFLPEIRMPAVQMPLTLLVDAASLVEASRVIQDLVCRSVKAGFAQAMAEIEQPAGGDSG